MAPSSQGPLSVAMQVVAREEARRAGKGVVAWWAIAKDRILPSDHESRRRTPDVPLRHEAVGGLGAFSYCHPPDWLPVEFCLIGTSLRIQRITASASLEHWVLVL